MGAELQEQRKIEEAERKKREKYERKIARAKAKQMRLLAHMYAQGIKPEVPKRTLAETRELRKWKGSVGMTGAPYVPPEDKWGSGSSSSSKKSVAPGVPGATDKGDTAL